MTDAPKKPTAESKLEQILAEYLRRKDAGMPVDVDSLCGAHPDIAEELKSYIAGEQLLDDLADDGQDTGTGSSDTSQSAIAETMKPGAAQRTGTVVAGRMIGRFKLLRELGAGAMGAVYLAEDTALGRQVAIKVPTVATGDGSEFLKRFQREAQAAAILSHPAICPVYDIGEEDGTPFITMAYIDGQPLSRFVGTEEFRDQRRVAEIVQTIAEALQHAHDSGIIHRDLKPGNVLVDETGFPVVTDFGLARRIAGEEETRITQEGHILGTPAYMSPEQVEGDPTKIGPATDVYALGTMLYELLTGHLPFRGSLASLLAQIVRDRPPRLSQHRAGVDRRLADLTLQMLEKSPDDRPSSMREVADRLQAWLDETSPESVAEQEKRRRIVEKLEAGKQQIERLLRRGQFGKAIAALEKMAALRSPFAKEYVAWAKAKIPEVKSLPKKIRENLPHLIETAKKLIRRHDYTQAAEMLQQVPEIFRSSEMQKLLDKALELQDESDLLLAALRQCVRNRDYQGIQDNLKRFLQLKPGNKFANELKESLETYRKVPAGSRKYRHDEDGNLQPHRRDFGDYWLLWGALCFALVFGLMSWGFTIYLKSGSETLYVTVLDESLLEDGTLSLLIDGDETIINGLDEHVSIKPGEHGYEVRHGDTVIAGPATLTIVSDGRNALEIGRLTTTFVPGLPDAKTEGWTDLFNGRDLTGWRQTGEARWTVEEGAISAPSGKNGSLVCERNFKDFELSLEVFTERQANGGVLFHLDDPLSTKDQGYEVQVAGSKGDTNHTGGIYVFAYVVDRQPANPANDARWFPLRVRVEGTRIQTWVDGKPMADHRGNSQRMPGGLLALSTLKRSAGSLKYRNIRIRELAPAIPLAAVGWTDLFNGRDLSGWNGLAARWQWRDGELVGTAQPQGIGFNTFLCSDRAYGDFEVEFEANLGGAKANSGLQIRSQLIDKGKYIAAGPQVDIGPGYWGSLYGEGTVGMMKRADTVLADRVVRPNDFNTYAVRCVGQHVTITVNGTTLVDDDFPDMPTAGILGWQIHKGPPMTVRFRNIRIRELLPAIPLSDAGWTGLFNGRDLAGWQPMLSEGDKFDRQRTTPGGWDVRNGELVCTTRLAGWLRSAKSYDDFELELEYKLPAGANSGLMFRTMGQGSLPKVGMEVQIIDDAAFAGTSALKSKSRTGAIFGAIPAENAPTNPPGQWNRMSLRCVANKIVVQVNGRKVIDASLSDYPELRSRPRSGYIGLFNWKGQAFGTAFRNIRIREL